MQEFIAKHQEKISTRGITQDSDRETAQSFATSVSAISQKDLKATN